MVTGLKSFVATKRSSNFRADIAGLRGIAVMMVTLCHFGIPGFSGGFIGPDVFFVLSGYLITGILFKEFSKKEERKRRTRKISIADFYRRRSKRILPASLFVVLSVNVYAHVFLSASQVTQISADSIWTVFFGANINFMRQATDYFAQTMSVSPLQHYWSLAVEEQFYFFWPMIFLWGASFRKLKFGKQRFSLEQRLRTVFLGAVVLSFSWLIFEFTTNPTSAYFSTFSRTWELALGGLLSMISYQTIAAKIGRYLPAIRITAFSALFASLVIVTSSNFGYTLIIPAVATGTLLLTGGQGESADLVERIMSTRALTALGTISYSLYLWHWPVAVFGRQLGYFNSVPERLGGVAGVIFLGMLGYYLIERPALNFKLEKFISVSRSRKRRSRNKVRSYKMQQSPVRTGASVALIVAVLGFAFYGTAGQSTGQTLTWVPPASAQMFAPVVSAVNTGNSAASEATLSGLEAPIAAWQKKVQDSIGMTTVPTDLKPDLTGLFSIAKFGGWTSCVGQRDDAATISKVCESTPLHTEGMKNAVMLGDSHSRIFWDAVTSSLDLKKWHVILLGMPGCPVPALQPNVTNVYNKDCAKHRELAIKYVEKNKPDLVVVSDAIDSTPGTKQYADAYDAVLPRITNSAKHVVLFEHSPSSSKLISCVTNGTSLAQCPAKPYAVDVDRKVQRQMASKYGLGYWNLSEALCAAKGGQLLCPPIIGNFPVAGDGSHIIPSASKALAPFLMRVLIGMKISDLASAPS